MSDEPLTSPLGDAASVDAAKRDHPGLAPVIDDLERVVTPPFDEMDRKAVATQRSVKRTRLIEMAGGATVAVLAIVQLSLDGRPEVIQGLGVAAAVIAVITAMASGIGRGRSVGAWIGDRQRAEELRSLYFRVLTSTQLRQDPNRKRVVRAEVNQILDPEHELESSDPTVAARPDVHPLDDDAWELYREARLRDQIGWMRAKADTVSARTNRLGSLQTALIVVASVCSALTAVGGSTLLAIPVAASATVITFIAAVDSVVASQRLAQHYQRTLARLELIDRSLDGDGSLGDVDEIETVLLAEQRAWQRITEGNQQ